MRRNRIILYGCIIGTGVLVAYQGGSLCYLLFYTSLFLPLLSLIYVFLVYWRFCIYQEIGTKVIVKEEKVPYLFKLCNEDRIAYTKVHVNFLKDYFTVEQLNQSADYSLLPKESVSRETKLICHYRGDYIVGIDSVIVTDYLNLFRFKYSVDSSLTVQVLPRVLHLNHLVCVPEDADTKQQLVAGVSASIPEVEVRNYQRGDSPRRIHWKATAKKGELMTRKFMEEQRTELVVFIDFRRLDGKEQERMCYEDKIIETALALVDYYIRNHIPVKVIFDQAGYKELHIQEGKEFQEFYVLCSQIRFQASLSCEQLLQQARKSSMKVRQYGLLLTGDISQELCKVAYQFVRMENELNIIQIGNHGQEDLLSSLDHRIHHYQIHYSDEVSDIMEGGNS